jgi:hypothetical protein
LASERFPPVLALEVEAGKASIAEEHPRADCAHGAGESNLGTRTSCCGTFAKVGDLRFAEDGGGILAVPPNGQPRGTWSQGSRTFVRNHAQAMLACDFAVVVTARFRVLYVFLLMEIATRRIVHANVAAHPTSEWTLQQFREALADDPKYRFLIHDRDAIFSRDLDHELKTFDQRVL